MAKPENGKIKFRYVEFELDSNSSALMESVKAAVALINKGTPVPRQMKSLGAGPQGNGGQTPPPVEDDGEVLDADPEVSEPANDDDGKPKKARSYPSPKVLDIDLKTGPVPFAEFAKAKGPEETIKKYCVCAAWLKEQRNITPIDANHIYTLFRHMDWTIQRDMNQPLRDGTRPNAGYFRKAGPGKFEITHIGLEVVHKMKPAPAAP